MSERSCRSVDAPRPSPPPTNPRGRVLKKGEPEQLRSRGVGDPAGGTRLEADAIVEVWLSSLSRSGDGRPPEVATRYRALAHTLLTHGLQARGEPGEPVLFEVDEVPGLARALAAVAAANRKAGLRMSQTLEDLARLELAALEWVRSRAGHAEGWASSLGQTTRIVLSLAGVARRLVYVLEESALRSQRESSEALAAMTDVLSHELGNRLGAALTASEMLLSANIELDERGLVRAAELVRSSVDAALHTVEDVRALAATRSKLEEPPPRSLELATLIRDVVDRQRSAANEAGVDIHVDEDIPDCSVDQARLRLIVFNLLANGIKYHDPDKETRTVGIAAQRTDGRIELRVSDNGVGIAADDVEDIFFYRTRGREAGSVPGSGLGLAIVSEAVDQIDGEIRVESEIGEGTRFTVVFEPLASTGPQERTAH